MKMEVSILAPSEYYQAIFHLKEAKFDTQPGKNVLMMGEYNDLPRLYKVDIQQTENVKTFMQVNTTDTVRNTTDLVVYPDLQPGGVIYSILDQQLGGSVTAPLSPAQQLGIETNDHQVPKIEYNTLPGSDKSDYNVTTQAVTEAPSSTSRIQHGSIADGAARLRD